MPVLIQPYYLGPESSSCVGGQGKILVKIRNETGDRLPAQPLQVVSTDYWESTRVDTPAVQPYSVQKVYIQLQARIGRKVEEVPDHVVLQLTQSGVVHNTALSFSFFNKALRQWSPRGLHGASGSRNFNILLVGAAGSTKSSFINSVLTLVSGPSEITLSPEMKN